MTSNQKKLLSVSLISSLVAIGFHVYLALKYYALMYGALSEKSACNFNSYLNCDAVSASSFSALFNIPMALWGAVTNGILVLLLLLVIFGINENRERAHRYTFLLSLFVALVSVVMGIISILFINNLCLFCVIAYVLSFVTLFGVWKSLDSGSVSEISGDIRLAFSSEKWILGFVVAIPILAFIINNMIRDQHAINDHIVLEKVQQWQGQAGIDFNLETGLVLKSEGSSPIMTIVEFADFRCIHCKHAYPSLHAFTQAHKDVQLIYKYFPLDGTCNPAPAMQGGGDGISCYLAFLSQCSEDLFKKGWDAHHLFFDNQEKIVTMRQREQILNYMCSELKLDCEALKVCADSEATREKIKGTAQEGAVAQVRGTPSVYVNGKLLVGGQTIPVLESTYKKIKEK